MIDDVVVSAYTVPTDEPESDATLEWDATTLVLVAIRAGGETGLGYTYGTASIAGLIADKLAPILHGRDTTDIAGAWQAMRAALRNEGLRGQSMMAISAVDVALWDLKARLMGVPVVHLVNPAHEAVPVYGSGGFTSYSLEQIAAQLGGWAEEGIGRVKMKVGRQPEDDPARLDAARKAIGEATELFVDANGGFSRKAALDWAHHYRAEWDVRWFEEPVSSDDLEGLALLRDGGPAGLDIAAGEYGYDLTDFRRWLPVVDCLQADVSRCGGFTGMLGVAALCASHSMDLSAHCVPNLSAHVLCGAQRLRHLEYFHDHVRIERLLFDGTIDPEGGSMRPDQSRPGLGLALKEKDAEQYRVL